ncbi:hypothetical protein BDY19DRAFT_348445 [Irpex rosettiformis]|uniref:Uncharacterized protein n=1 Tax=Irpex rosettiformis TaxID=378272 RepID=A0ACB8TWY9_9APHY|nr:hypothetical protein BDY19DRAFT_348445 [Irpex rosettiformis]
MTDQRSFISVGMSASVQGHSNPQATQQDFPQGYPQQSNEDSYRRGSPNNVSFTGRSLFPPARPSSQAYGGPMSVQLPSLNGVFHDPTRSLYGPGTSALPPGSYGAPSPSDENMNTFRIPLNAAVPSSHPSSHYDYHPHHQQDFHHDRHNAHSQASYRNHPHLPEHPSTSVPPNIPSNPSPGPSTYSQSRQHHPHQQVVPSMMYNPHHPEPSSSAFNRSFAPSGPQPYTNSHSSPSPSPQLEVTPSIPSAPSNPVKTEDRPVPSTTASSSRSTKRREKPKIELSPDQPLTTQGKPRARVYVACVQCCLLCGGLGGCGLSCDEWYWWIGEGGRNAGILAMKMPQVRESMGASFQVLSTRFYTVLISFAPVSQSNAENQMRWCKACLPQLFSSSDHEQ